VIGCSGGGGRRVENVVDGALLKTLTFQKNISLARDTFSSPYMSLSQIHHQTLTSLAEPGQMSE